jgi:hypothetical protein
VCALWVWVLWVGGRGAGGDPPPPVAVNSLAFTPLSSPLPHSLAHTLALSPSSPSAVPLPHARRTHRTLHHPSIYPYVHKIHHEYHHPIALASEHAHPIEFFLGNLVPVITGPILLGSHCVTIWMWILVRIGVSIDEHGGYSFPWSPVRLLPFGATADGHDFHHSQDKNAMFASQFTVLDCLGGTEGRYQEWRARMAAEKEGGVPIGGEGKKRAAAAEAGRGATRGSKGD